MRDGFDMPLVLKYDRRHYNETSPWVMFTKGADSCREDTQWKVSDLAYMSRGMVCAYPLLRGTNYFDQDYRESG
jgi:protease II